MCHLRKSFLLLVVCFQFREKLKNGIENISYAGVIRGPIACYFMDAFKPALVGP